MKPAFPQVWDSTMRNDFVACGMKYKYAHVDLLTGQQENVDLVAGAALAAGLETTRREMLAGLPFEQAKLRGTTSLLRAYTIQDVPENKVHKDLAHTLRALDAYWREYPPAIDPFQIAVIEGHPMIEFTFCFELPVKHPETGLPIQYAGRYDWTAFYQNSYGCADEKTCSQVPFNWAQKWRLRFQFTGYAYAANLYGIPVKFTLIRGIHMLKTEVRFPQAIVYQEPWKLERWYKQLLRDVERARQCFLNGEWDMNLGDSCTAYNGCPYTDLCEARDPSQWLHLYKKLEEPWSPLKQFKESTL